MVIHDLERLLAEMFHDPRRHHFADAAIDPRREKMFDRLGRRRLFRLDGREGELLAETLVKDEFARERDVHAFGHDKSGPDRNDRTVLGLEHEHGIAVLLVVKSNLSDRAANIHLCLRLPKSHGTIVVENVRTQENIRKICAVRDLR